MAKIYPAVITTFHGSEGEKQVYKALQQLNDEYVVFCSFRWLGEKTQRRSEGEADFVVLHPRKGILSIEVKAGGIAYRDGNWIQINRMNRQETYINPLGQAAESQFRILNLLRRHLSYSECPCVGRAAWFPSICLPDHIALPLEAAPDIILDQAGLSCPEQALEKAFSYWARQLGGPFPASSSIQFQEIVKLLMPTFQIAETVVSSGRENTVAYVQLTRQQFSILEFLKEQPTAAIHGPAGTGKTLLAVEKARMLAQEHKKVLYLCFNEFLLEHLRTHCAGEYISFHNVRSLAEEILQDTTLPIQEIIPFFETYFDQEFDDADWQYPNIVVDEGQDISDDILAHLDYLVKQAGGQFYIFYDRNQYIMRRDKPEWIDKEAECRLVLYRNCRNTAEIATAISAIMSMRPDTYINEIHGITPKGTFYTTNEELRCIAGQFIRSMRSQQVPLEDMVILSVHSVQNSGLCGIQEIDGVPLSETGEKGAVWFTSVRKFKGLEAKAVLLVDIELSRLPQPVLHRLLYVGCSRANTYLQAAFYEDIPKGDYGRILKSLTDAPVKGNRAGLLKLLGMEHV